MGMTLTRSTASCRAHGSINYFRLSATSVPTPPPFGSRRRATTSGAPASAVTSSMRHRRRRSFSISPIMITPFRSARLRSVNRPALLSLPDAGHFLASLDADVVVTALLPMLTSVHIPVNRAEQATPIITGFLLGYLAVMPIAGGLSDRF